MTTDYKRKDEMRSKIVVQKDGPYAVRWHIPLVRKEQVVSEHGEPLTWRTGDLIEAGETYSLCRCGQTRNRPFCDDTHAEVGFDGTQKAKTGSTAERQVTYEGGTGIVVRRDVHLCARSGFCANRTASIKEMVPDTADSQVRAQVMRMIEHCPSGSYVYSLEEGGPDIEPNLPRQIAVTIEITSSGPIDGPLWVTGSIPVERADGEVFEPRPRVTLCRCGQSRRKPLCDGTHRGDR